VARLLAVDPGRDKCGLAVVDQEAGILERAVVPVEEIADRAREAIRVHRPDACVVGSGTGSHAVRGLLRSAGLAFRPVGERDTTAAARIRYFRENRPRGWRRFVPAGLLFPPVPVDDWAAVIIAEQCLVRGDTGPGEE
jgi:hypothetical protein